MQRLVVGHSGQIHRHHVLRLRLLRRPIQQRLQRRRSGHVLVLPAVVHRRSLPVLLHLHQCDGVAIAHVQRPGDLIAPAQAGGDMLPGVHGAAGAVIGVLHHDAASVALLRRCRHLPVLHQRGKGLPRVFARHRVVGVQRQRPPALLTGGDQLAAVSVRAILPVAARRTEGGKHPVQLPVRALIIGLALPVIGIGCRHRGQHSLLRGGLFPSPQRPAAHGQRRQRAHAQQRHFPPASPPGDGLHLPRHLRGGAVGAEGGVLRQQRAALYTPLCLRHDSTSLRAFFYHIPFVSPRKECRGGQCPSQSAAPYMP